MSCHSLLDDRIFRPWRKRFVIFQSFFCELDRLFELWIVTADDEVGALRHDVIGIDAVIFNDPFATVVRGPKGRLRRSNIAAVTKRDRAVVSHESAPRARSHDRADFFSVKKPRKSVATGAR